MSAIPKYCLQCGARLVWKTYSSFFDQWTGKPSEIQELKCPNVVWYKLSHNNGIPFTIRSITLKEKTKEKYGVSVIDAPLFSTASVQKLLNEIRRLKLELLNEKKKR